MRRTRPLLLLGLALAGGCARRPAAVPPPAPMPPAPIAPGVQVPSPREAFTALADSLLDQPAFRTAWWGVLVVDAEAGDTIYARHADKLFLPASNQKLLTGAAAVAVLGPDFRFRTVVATDGAVRRGTLRGDLWIGGEGDPGFSAALRGGDALAAFTPIVEALRARGVRRIVGTLRGEGDALPGPTIGNAWEADDLDGPSGAAIDELFFDEGVFELVVTPGRRVGAPVRARTTPLPHHPRVVIEAITVAADTTGPRPRLSAGWDSTATAVVVRGALAVGDSASFDLAYRHPADAWRAAAVEALRRGGIIVEPPPRGSRRRVRLVPRGVAEALPPRATGGDALVPSGVRQDSVPWRDTLVVLTSPPFPEVLARMEKPSQNQLAELLYRTVGRVRTGSGAPDSAQRVVERLLAEWGVARDEVAVRDGSGLSRHNYVTPRTVVRVLDAMRRHPHFRLFHDALPVAGRDGTIAGRMRGTPAEGNVHAKTGTLDKVRSLSGYVTTPDGRLLLFSILCNNWSTPVREVDRVADALAARLAVLRLDRRE